ncbi:uncharacterized protein PpBr36_10204 [Pyricularia pennisetigena]|uniref:uncharacterized protein n=1 Tax=Pyricularia pennisetigena TaxID=1578925 RepID=UPI00114E8857|nr:uncharacterized protein PpBr36_10204 [Pyricularia pennisetigena]TLS21369.1 hypothetical protein PpBr36_10204 [Pyricularia pennisetigena]
MSDGDGDAIARLGGLAEGLLDDLFAFGVEGAGGLVEQQDLGVADEGAGDGDALPLAARELGAVGPGGGAEAVGQRRDEIPGVGGAEGALDGGVVRRRRLPLPAVDAQRNVLPDRALEQRRLLLHQRHDPPVQPRVQLRQRVPAYADAARRRVVEALQHGDYGRLAAPGRADQGHKLAALDLERYVLEHGGLGPEGVGEADVVELDGAAGARGAVFVIGRGRHALLVENWKICDVAWAEKNTDIKDTKNWNRVISRSATSLVPYQKPRAMNQNSTPCVAANQTIMLASGLFDELTALSSSWHGALNGEGGDGADGGDGLGGDGGAGGQASGGLAVQLGVEAHLQKAAADDDGQAGQDDDEAELPAEDDAEDAARGDVQGGGGDEADVEAHELKDGLRVGVDAAGQGADVVLGPVEELQVLAQDLLEDVAAQLVGQGLADDVGVVAQDVVEDEAAGGQDDEHGGQEVAPRQHLVDGEREDLDHVRHEDGLGGEEGAGHDAGAQDGEHGEPQTGRLPDHAEDRGDEAKLLVVLVVVPPELGLDPLLRGGGVLGERLGLPDDVVLALGVDGVLLLPLLLAAVRLRVALVGAGGELLDLDEPGVGAVLLDQALVRALLDDAALGHDHDVVGLADGRELVRDHDGRPAHRRLVQRLLHDALGVRVQGAGGLVQEEHLWLRHHRARDGDALLLPARQQTAALANLGVVALGELRHKVVRECDLGGFLHPTHLFLPGRRLPGGSDKTIQRLDRPPVQLYGALVRVIPPLQQANDGALARTARPDQSSDLAGRRRQRKVVQHGDAGPGRVGKVDALELHDALVHLGLQAARVERVDDALAVDESKQLSGGGGGAGELDAVGGDLGQAEGGDDDGQQHGEDVSAVPDLAGGQHAEALPEGEPVAQVDDGVLGREQDAEEERDLVAPAVRLAQELVKLGHQPLAHLKGVHRPHAAQHPLRVCVGLRVLLEHLGLVPGLDEGHDGHEDDAQRRHPAHDQRQLPVGQEGDDEGADERRHALDRQPELLRRAVLDQPPVGVGLRRDGAAVANVKVRHLLPQRRLEVLVPDVAHHAVGRVRQQRVVDVRHHKPADAEVDVNEAV